MVCVFLAGKKFKMKIKRIIKEEHEEDEFCMKCGKSIDLMTSAEFGGKCSTCWFERNE